MGCVRGAEGGGVLEGGSILGRQGTGNSSGSVGGSVLSSWGDREQGTARAVLVGLYYQVEGISHLLGLPPVFLQVCPH